jgi:hypothetical protein
MYGKDRQIYRYPLENFDLIAEIQKIFVVIMNDGKTYKDDLC